MLAEQRKRNASPSFVQTQQVDERGSVKSGPEPQPGQRRRRRSRQRRVIKRCFECDSPSHLVASCQVRKQRKTQYKRKQHQKSRAGFVKLQQGNPPLRPEGRVRPRVVCSKPLQPVVSRDVLPMEAEDPSNGLTTQQQEPPTSDGGGMLVYLPPQKRRQRVTPEVPAPIPDLMAAEVPATLPPPKLTPSQPSSARKPWRDGQPPVRAPIAWTIRLDEAQPPAGPAQQSSTQTPVSAPVAWRVDMATVQPDVSPTSSPDLMAAEVPATLPPPGLTPSRTPVAWTVDMGDASSPTRDQQQPVRFAASPVTRRVTRRSRRLAELVLPRRSARIAAQQEQTVGC